MTLGVAPGASKATTEMTEGNQTSLTGFVDDDTPDNVITETSSPDRPTPAENAADIARLVDLMQDLTDHVGALVDERGQPDPAENCSEDIGSDPTGMFH